MSNGRVDCAILLETMRAYDPKFTFIAKYGRCVSAIDLIIKAKGANPTFLWTWYQRIFREKRAGRGVMFV